MSMLNGLFAESGSLAEYASRYTNYLASLLSQLDCDAIERVGAVLEDARRQGRTIFIVGNGGSAATASHCATDLGFGPRVFGGDAYRAVSLSDNNALLTAAGNDTGYDTVFAEQLRTLMSPGDVVIAISASGNSPNIVKAIEYAKHAGGITIGFTGFDGGRLRQIAHESLHVATPHGDYGPVEDMHLILNHLITTYLVRLTRQKKEDALMLVRSRAGREETAVAAHAEAVRP